MNTYRYILDKTSKKFQCPSCGRKRLVRYVDTLTGDYLPDHVGRCDREVNCQYHYTAFSYQKESSATVNRVYSSKSNAKQKTSHYLPYGLLEKSMAVNCENNFLQYVATLFNSETIQDVRRRFHIGTATHWRGATVFWQVDIAHFVRAGKIMLYHAETGRRVKEPYNRLHWVHSLMEKRGLLHDFELKQCFFGENQLAAYPDKTVAIVESEKTAVLMTVLLPDYLWLACGSANNLKASICEVLKDRNIILFPDLNCFDLWKKKAAYLGGIGFRVRTSTLLERYATANDRNNGLDLADFFIRTDKSGLAITDAGYPVLWDISDKLKIQTIK
ncbi:DUF6371 domain-containing protein [Fulvivirga ulvae]|uniref:DUF6371 domain-containing protein n=1 Tax=Fulvivirga ulvae TaxID=2904245 RepID=UPI001F1CCB08|nr:DUF6371 domain-containing protein [Fulvivirga ulvae]UII32828.1 DUF6371 domain-containing protein [Fulvivirga ulvae]